jgi:hypothetical protein
MILPNDHPLIQGLFDLCRTAESPEMRKILRELAADIRAACVAQRSEILRPMAAARVAEWN